jgi:hypothetical protein
MGFGIVHWNGRGIKDKLPVILPHLGRIDLLCIQESLLKKHTKLWCKEFQIFRKDIAACGDSGICILARNHIICSHMDLAGLSHPSLELMGVTVKFQDKEGLIVNVYRHPSQKTPPAIWTKIFNLQQKYPYMLVLGDVNAHHGYWHCDFEDSAGKMFASAIEDANFAALNEDSSTFLTPSGFHLHRGTNVIDLSLASRHLTLWCSSHVGKDC